MYAKSHRNATQKCGKFFFHEIKPAICDAKAQNACCFLDIELEVQIGERGFRVCNSSIQLVFVNLP